MDLAIRTLFAEFQEATFKRFEVGEKIVGSPTFVSKNIKGKKYWYRQHYVDGKAIQKYHFPSSTENDQIVFQTRKEQQENRNLLRQLLAQEQKRAAMLKRGGLPCLDFFTASVLEALADARLIYKEGILIGSYAFWSYPGLLGVHFDNTFLKTLDIDMAFDPAVSVSLKEPINLLKLLKSIDERFREVPPLSPKYAPHSYIGPYGLRVDVLAPLIGKHRGDIRLKNIIGARAEPVRFLDFLMEKPVQSVLISPKGGIPVTVPHPARYAVHKLIVAARRSVTESAKKQKDIAQAGSLIATCLKEEPAELKSAFRKALKSGKKWKAYILSSMEHLPAEIKVLTKLL